MIHPLPFFSTLNKKEWLKKGRGWVMDTSEFCLNLNLWKYSSSRNTNTNQHFLQHFCMEKCKINIYLIIPVFNLDHVSFNIMHSFIFFNIFLINIDLTPPNIETCYIFCFRKKLIVERFVMVSFVRKSLIIIFSIRQPNTISKLGSSLFIS